MKRFIVPATVVAALFALLVQIPVASSHSRPTLEFQTMAPVTGPFVGSANPVRGINGGGLPWQIESAEGQLARDRVQVNVRGLVLFDGPPVPENRRGTNPIANFVAIVSCLTISNGAPATVNVATSAVPASSDGDANINAPIDLPTPCIAPIVFVGPNATTWFAATGR